MSTCCGWLSGEEIVTAGDDHKLIIWNSASLQIVRKIDLPENLFPTDLHVLPRKEGVNRQSTSSSLFALSSDDGYYHIYDRNGRLEKSIQAHQGAVIVIRWANDGTSLVTGGEDGAIKMWSKTGMLRSTLATLSCPVYTLAWSPQSDSIVFAAEKSLQIKPLSSKIKSIIWKGHDKCILKVVWNSVNHTIISGGEDNRYKIWDENGRILFISNKIQYSITSLATSLDGLLIAVACFNCLYLCDQKGWIYSSHKTDTQNIFNIAWCNNSTQIVSSSGSGSIFLAQIVEKKLDWRTFQLQLTDKNSIRVNDIDKNIDGDYEFKENITKISIGFDHLIVITSTQCHIYKVNNMNLAHSMNLKDAQISLIIQSIGYFMLIDSINVNLCLYEGRYVDTIKGFASRVEFLTNKTISLSPDTIASLDVNDKKQINFIDIQNLGKSKSSSLTVSNDVYNYRHKIDVDMICLDQIGQQNERKCAFIDANSDLYISLIKSPSWALRTIKFRSIINSIGWCDEGNILSAISNNNKLIVCFNPHNAFVDKELLDMCCKEYDLENNDLSLKHQTISGFTGNRIQLEVNDGSKLSVFVSPFVKMLHLYVINKKWSQALQLCRFARNLPESWQLWSSLAGLAIQHRNLEIAEIAYSSIMKVDRVMYIQQIQLIADKSAKSAEIAVICGNVKEAENILIASRYIFRAIQLNLEMYNWERALELMKNHDKEEKYAHLIVYYRRKYLEKFEKQEINTKLLQLSEKVGKCLLLWLFHSSAEMRMIMILFVIDKH